MVFRLFVLIEIILDKLVLPIQNEIIKATKVEREVQIQSDSSPLRSPRDREEDDRAERRKATSFENVKGNIIALMILYMLIYEISRACKGREDH